MIDGRDSQSRRSAVQVEALRNELAILQDVLEGAQDGLVRTTPDGRIQFASGRMVDLIGWRPVELAGQRGYDYIHRDDYELLRQHLVRVRAAGSSERPLDLRVLHRDGSVRWAQACFRAQRDPATGRLRGFIAQYRPLSDRERAEAALRRSPDWLDLLSSLGRVEFAVMCVPEQITSRSPGFASLVGFAPGDEPGDHLTDWTRYMLPEDRLRLQMRITHAAADPRPEPLRFTVIGHDQRRRMIESRAVYSCAADGRLVRVVAVMRDISEQIRIETELREGGRLLQQLLDSLPDGVLRLDRQRRVQYASPACLPVLGLRPEQLLGLRIEDAWPDPDSATRLQLWVEQALEHADSPGTLELEIGPAGARRYLQLRYTVERSPEARADTVLALVRDISSLKQAELQARRAAERLRGVFDNADIGVSVWDATHQLRFANRRLHLLLGYAEGEMEALGNTRLFVDHDQVCAQMDAPQEAQVWHRDGRMLNIRLTIVPLLDSSGHSEGCLGLWTDLSEREHARHRARRLSDRLTYLLETVGEGIAFLDPEHHILFANARLEQMLGAVPGSLIGQGAPFPLPPPSSPSTGAEAMEYRANVLRPDGQPLSALLRVRTSYTAQGQMEGRLVTLLDQTTERQGRDAINRLSRLLDTAGEGIGFTDTEDRLVYANRKLAQWLGLHDAPMGVTPLAEWLHTDHPLPRALEMGAEGVGESFAGMLRCPHGDLPCEVNATPLFDESGLPEGALYTLVDQSSRERLRLEAQSTTEWLEAALAGAGIGSFDVDLAQDEVRVTQLIRDLCGAEFTYVRWLDTIHPADRGVVSAAIDRLQRGESMRVEFRTTETPARWYFAVLNAQSGDGTLRRVIGTQIDITALKALENERSQLQAQINQSQRQESLGLLAGGVAHDFNNLLTSAIGHLELARLEAETPTSATNSAGTADSLALVDQALHQMSALAQQLQAFSGKGQQRLKLLDLVAVVESFAGILKVSAGVHARLVLDLADSALPLDGDATQLQQILMNLVINAAEAMGEQGGEIRLSAHPARADQLPETLQKASISREYLLLEVCDEGPGISPEVQERLFEPFFSSKARGSGLGLPVVAGAVRAHRGLMQVHNQTPRGCCFRIWLPRAQTLPEVTLTSTLDARAATPRLGRLRGLILLVDDDDAVRGVIRRALALHGLQVREARDGGEALQALAEAPAPDLLLMDIVMPRMSGVEALLSLRAQGHTLPVVLMSGFAERQELGRLKADPPQAMLRKPFKPAELLATLAPLLEGLPAPPAGAA